MPKCKNRDRQRAGVSLKPAFFLDSIMRARCRVTQMGISSCGPVDSAGVCHSTRNLANMRTLLFVVFSVSISLPAFAQKEAREPREYPWERAAKRLEADQAKMPRPKKNEDKRQSDIVKPETKAGYGDSNSDKKEK
jgi:hypothetical protein